MDHKKTCSSCRFWERDGHPIIGGLCRRHSPELPERNSGEMGWPGTRSVDWCGEYAAIAINPTPGRPQLFPRTILLSTVREIAPSEDKALMFSAIARAVQVKAPVSRTTCFNVLNKYVQSGEIICVDSRYWSPATPPVETVD